MSHTHHQSATVQRLRVAFGLNLAFAIIEIAGSYWTNSAAILADAVHDFGDATALGLALILERVANRKPDRTFSFGYRRFSLLGATTNATILLIGALFVMSEAIPKLWAPVQPYTTGMMALAVLGILVNGAAVVTLQSGSTLNEKVASWHLLEDVLGWIAVLVVAIAMGFWDVPILDPLLSIAISIYILHHAWEHLRKALTILLQGVPDTLDVASIEAAVAKVPGVIRVHHTHIWSQDGEHHVLTTHVQIAENATMADSAALKCAIRETLAAKGIHHATVETEAAASPPCADDRD